MFSPHRRLDTQKLFDTSLYLSWKLKISFKNTKNVFSIIKVKFTIKGETTERSPLPSSLPAVKEYNEHEK